MIEILKICSPYPEMATQVYELMQFRTVHIAVCFLVGQIALKASWNTFNPFGRQEVLGSLNQWSESGNKYPTGGEATDYCANDNMTAGASFGHLTVFCLFESL